MIPTARPRTIAQCLEALGGKGVAWPDVAGAPGFGEAYRRLARRVAVRDARTRRNIAAVVHVLRGETDRAIECLEASLRRDFSQYPFQALLAELLMATGRWDAYAHRGAFGLEIVAALEGLAGPPGRYHPELVGKVFDRLSPGYEERVLRESYAEHVGVAQRIARLPDPGRRPRVLDLGCGTGMLGEALRGAGSAATLIGVDASAAMLEQARRRGLYDELHQDDIAHFLGARAGRLDIDAAGLSSVIPFFGELGTLFGLLRAGAHRGTRIVFTFDVAESEGVQFNEHGRFRHAPGYVRDRLAEAGFRVESEEPFIARLEAGRPVASEVVVAGVAPD